MDSSQTPVKTFQNAQNIVQDLLIFYRKRKNMLYVDDSIWITLTELHWKK